jgi:hypothetical protein
MTNSTHVEILRQGLDIWNLWRKEHPEIKPQLNGVRLRSAMLRNYDLSNANLIGADLRDSNFRHTDLSGADLNAVKAHRCFFSNSRFTNTCFKQTVLYETVFANVDLSQATYLDTCIHKGPSVVDNRTLAKTKNLPIEFLRGCGLPDSVINTDIVESYWSCFISYSSKDQEFADMLYNDLQVNGVRCWFAPKDIRIGDKFRFIIDEAIHETEILLIVLSKNSIQSNWVEKEVETAFEKESAKMAPVLFPIRLDDAVLKTNQPWASDIRRIRHIGDFTNSTFGVDVTY